MDQAEKAFVEKKMATFLWISASVVDNFIVVFWSIGRNNMPDVGVFANFTTLYKWKLIVISSNFSRLM